MEALDVGGYALVSLAALVFLFLQSWFAATVVRRVVGVPTGWPRTLAVGLVMSAVVAVTVQYLYRAGTGQNVDGLDVSPGVAVLFMVLALGWIFALGVGALVMLEAAFPTGSLPSPQSLFFGWRSRRRRARRYAQVVSIAVRHGLGSQLRGFGGDSPGREVKTARALKESLAEAGVTFVKLGQMLSTRRDILPPVFVRELETLQTQVTPEPWSVIEPAIAERLGRPIGEVFARIDSTPLAAASVAQVHEATLLDGTEVIVKVQRPKALNQVAQDLDIILRLAGWLNKTTTWGRDLGVQSLAAGFANTLEEELDYRIELDNMASIEASLTRSGKFDVTVPHGYPGLSGERLLVMDRLPGQPVSRAGALLTGLSDAERSRLATTLLGATLEQIIGDGIFHADLHAGNIFITPERKLGLLDFGAVGRLDPATQTSLGLMLYSIDQNDSAGATDALIELLGRPDGLDDREVERAVGELLLRYGGGTRATQGQKLFDDLFNLVLAHRFSVPAPISAAFRAMASVEGALLTIDPNFDVVAVSRKEGNRLVRSKLKGTKITDELQRRALQLMPMIDRMPRRINKITEDLEQGRFSMNMRVLENPSDRSFLTSLFQQLIVAVLAGAAVVGAIMLITSDEGPLLTKDIHLYSFFGFVLLFGGFVLSMRSLMLVFRRDGQT
ncbi:ABC1 kinase family protein [Brevibacterium linens]|uniref:Ubiquinone biosynthesis protein n=1 Tax=Brevibacterium linens ATCC 9172 TaxID=1255617 RepID=A0A2H1J178_BRELN|nr:AarF/UbiB family protein [Brevibacterium linens]AZU01760.1 AarF/ABC1/UbiB kinase family protein [Brevibacterium linens]KAB1947516.1 AarF/ABC1/UbiB kinase family protein [Brevibacterium linens ATCC 9172]SMX81227.1 ubiquinone biosynthesis protein [Brevibacterium linens ATCC 9172]